MTPEEIADLLKRRFGPVVTDMVMGGGHPYVTVTVDRWPDVALFLRDEPTLRFNMLRCISTLDLLAENQITVIYDLIHLPTDRSTDLLTDTHEFAIRLLVDRNNPHVPTVCHVWPAADWHEREAYDLMGVIFDGHPDLRRILLADDWVGHPLRKDYEFPMEYNGIPCTTEYDLPNPKH